MKQKKGAALGACILLLATLFSFEIQTVNPSNFENFDANYIPDDKRHIELAQKYNQEKQPKLAIKHYKKAIEINPQNFKGIFELANTLYINSRFDEAIEIFDKAENICPQYCQIYFNRSLCHMQKKDIEKTIGDLKKAIEVNPEYEKAHNQLGLLLHQNNRDYEAIKYLKKMLQKNPTSFQTTFLLAKSTRNIDNLQGAKQLFQKAYKMRPDSTILIIELANTLNMLNEVEAALALYKKALKNNPNQPNIQYNYAYTLKKMGRVEESLEIYQQVLKEKPDYAQAHFSLALAYLLLGNFKEGWKEYEWRWKAYKETKKSFDKPAWDGSDPAGQTILLCAEQGLGDTFQFIRYAKLLKERGATIIVQTQRPLTTILKLCNYIDVVVPRGKALPHFNCYVYLMSLPLLFKTTVDTIPDIVPYLHADPQLVQYWKEKLSKDNNFKIGICWQGNKGYRTQALKHAVAAKSMHARLFKPLAELPGVSLYCLQKMNGEEQLKEIDFKIHTFGPDFDKSHGRFMDTAAIIKNLDLIITVDTSICHFAAALGAPVWTILPLPADWRWMLHTDKTPWYSNMRLFRQKEINTWEQIIQQMVQELCSILDIPNPQQQNTPDILDISYGPTITNNIDNTTDNNSTKKSQYLSISLKNIDHMKFQEILDKIIILKIKYNETQDKAIEQELKKAELQLRNLSQIYSTSSEKLDELSEKLYDLNSQLINIDKQIAQIENKSVFNQDFIALAKQAHYIKNLKNYIKNEIEKIVQL